MQTLRSILNAEIDRQGAISFARFMEIALYAPGLGYYEHSQAVGAAADFYTSVSVGPLFGELLAYQFARWLEQLDSPRLQLIEAASHHGQLARDILVWFGIHEPQLLARMEYVILEPSRALQTKQRVALMDYPVRWISSWDDLKSKPAGIIFANELLDAFPTHLISWDKSTGIWRELGVTRSGEIYLWTPLANPSVNRENMPRLPRELLDVLPDGFRTEVNPGVLDWWRNAANALKTGWLVTIDYGLDTEEFFSPQRGQGTVRGYQKHRPSDNVLDHPGQQDITTQVDFAKLRAEGEGAGLSTNGYISQTAFLTKIVEQISVNSEWVEWTPSRLRQFQTLTHPNHLGRSFKVLIQRRRSCTDNRVTPM